MIDLTNKPEGATHYAVTKSGKVCWYLINGSSYKHMYCDATLWSSWSTGDPMHAPLNKVEDWSIYNNTKPLGGLSDEQRGLLFNHHCNGGVMQNNQVGGSEVDVFYDTDSWAIWSLHTTYRAKQKSERELFVESAMKFCIGGKRAEDTFSDMFNAGFKAPKVGE